MILDVTGQEPDQGLRRDLRLAGRRTELSVTLSSLPALPQDELLLLVALGTTSAEAGKSPRGPWGEMVRLHRLRISWASRWAVSDRIQISMEKTDTNSRSSSGGQLTEGCPDALLQSISGTAKRVLRVEHQIGRPLLLAGRQDFPGALGAISCCGCDSDEAAHPASCGCGRIALLGSRAPPFSAIPGDREGRGPGPAQDFHELVRAASSDD